MTRRRGLAAAIGLAALIAVATAVWGFSRQSASGASGGTSNALGVVFTVFENLPPIGACSGLYSVDAQTRRITYLGGLDDARSDSAVYPAFTAGGAFSYGHWVDTTANVPLVDVFAGQKKVARALVFTGWAWSPRREEVAYGRLEGRRLDLVLGSVDGSQRVLARNAGPGVSWLPNGSGLLYVRRDGPTYVISFVRRDGSGRRDVARNALFPVVSPDGRRFAFVRNADTRPELWVSALRGGRAKRLLGPAGYEELRPAVWLSTRELLTQHGGQEDPNFDVGDRVTRLDVVTGRERPFLPRAYVLSRSPDGRRVLFVRRHGGGEYYYSIRTVTTAGREERLLAVADEEDMNIRSWPVWKPAGTELSYIGDPLPARVSVEECVRRVTSLRDRTR